MDKVSILKSMPLFKNLNDEELKVIASYCREETFPSGFEFIEQDEPSNKSYIIYKGLVKIFRITEDGDEINLSILGVGEVVGEMGLIDDQPRSACVQTIQETKVLTLSKLDFEKILHNNPEVSLTLLKTMAQRLRSVSNQLESVMSTNLYKRTLRILQALGSFFPNKEITLSQEELAAIIGATRARVTEVLNTLKKEGKIQLQHRKIHVI